MLAPEVEASFHNVSQDDGEDGVVLVGCSHSTENTISSDWKGGEGNLEHTHLDPKNIKDALRNETLRDVQCSL